MWIVVVTVVIGVLLVIINKNSEDINIADLIPEQVRTYGYDGEVYTSRVENVNIVRQNTENGINTTYCEVELKDENLTRIAYLCLECKKYEKGGWYVENFNAYEKEQIKEWNSQKANDMVEKEIQDLSYKDNLNFVSNEIDNSSKNPIAKVKYSIDKNFKYLNISGEICFDVTLERKYGVDYNTGADSYPIEYSFDKNISKDFSNLKEIWNLDGTWNAHAIDSTGRFPDRYEDFTIQISNSQSNILQLQTIYKYHDVYRTSNYLVRTI